MKRLEKQIVVVTGGSSGLGKAIGLEAAKQGATVVFLARRMAALKEAQATATALSGRPAYAFVCDVADPVAVEAVAARIARDVGPVDVLVNAAGFGHFENALETKMSTVEQMMRVNVLGTMYMTRLIGRGMVERGHGHIINIASMAGKIATPKSAIYSASKFAVVGYSNGLRLELRPHGVRVTTVNPGPVNTAFFQVAEANDYLQKVSFIVLDADKLARRIVYSFGLPVREINTPLIMAAAAKFYDLAPHVGDFLAGTLFNRK
ncbi:SDR family NAD(P)-dependent oxidoreductase [Lacticaseibacillus yichunensis]|uniref:SDR family NAD(P)-dependent oxidoreductase n=1 Tax=Lacticaseibacillus yichunensis TaxID=2486015 RepID=A0ABW4CUB6_9LACO|nr:SDR family oxidoreductase [Lacticaseibacillus yichunensis]